MLGSSDHGHWRRRGGWCPVPVWPDTRTHCGLALGVKNLANLVGCLMGVHNLLDIWSTFVYIWYIEELKSTPLLFLWWLEWPYAVLSKTAFGIWEIICPIIYSPSTHKWEWDGIRNQWRQFSQNQYDAQCSGSSGYDVLLKIMAQDIFKPNIQSILNNTLL